MPWGIYEGDVRDAHDPDLDQFRESIGTVTENGEQIGYVATSVGISWGLIGWRWWRPRWGDPEEKIDALLTIVRGPRAPKVVHDVLDADFEGGTFWLDEDALAISWLRGDERDRAWETYGWDRDREDILRPPSAD